MTWDWSAKTDKVSAKADTRISPRVRLSGKSPLKWTPAGFKFLDLAETFQFRKASNQKRIKRGFCDFRAIVSVISIELSVWSILERELARIITIYGEFLRI